MPCSLALTDAEASTSQYQYPSAGYQASQYQGTQYLDYQDYDDADYTY